METCKFCGKKPKICFSKICAQPYEALDGSMKWRYYFCGGISCGCPGKSGGTTIEVDPRLMNNPEYMVGRRKMAESDLIDYWSEREI